MDLSASFSSFLADISTDSTDIVVMGIANQFLLQVGTPTLGGQKGELPPQPSSMGGQRGKNCPSN